MAEKKTDKYIPKRVIDYDLWNNVQKLSQIDDGKIEASDIIFKDQYKLPPENIELIKNLAKPNQPINVRRRIASNLVEFEHIPFGMYSDLFDILSTDPDIEVQNSLKKTSFSQLSKSIQPLLAKIQPTALTIGLQSLVKRQEELLKSLTPLVQLQNTEFVKQLAASNRSEFLNRIADLQKSLKAVPIQQIRIPKTPIDIVGIIPKIKTDISVDSILPQVKELTPEQNASIDERFEKLEELEKKLAEATSDVPIDSQVNESIETKKKIDEYEKKLDKIANDRDNIMNEVVTKLKVIDKKQDHTENLINRKLSPTQTIGVALAVGFISSIIGSLAFEFIIKPPILIATNSTLP